MLLLLNKIKSKLFYLYLKLVGGVSCMVIWFFCMCGGVYLICVSAEWLSVVCGGWFSLRIVAFSN